MVVHLYSPDKSRDPLFISNFATLEITDPLTRVDGVGSITVFGSRDYSMRIWLDPDRLQALNMTANDVVLALQGQNVQVASGVLNQPPMADPGAFQIAVRTQGRLANPEEFGNIIVKNAILIVEFAKQIEDGGKDRFAAAVEAARLRLRPILMTSLAFILGVSPLVWAIGAGAELRQTLGTAVFSGMIGVTVFGLIFTPAFYVLTRSFAARRRRPHAQSHPHPAE